MRKLTKALSALILALAAILPSQAAFAHAQLVSANPAADSVIVSAPDQVTLTFDEALMVVNNSTTANQIQVTNEAGDRVDQGDSKLDGAVLTVSLKSDLPDGKYNVAYRFVADDGHAEQAAYTFEVSPATTDTTSTDGATPVAIDATAPTLYDAQRSAPASGATGDNGAATGWAVAVGAVLVGGATFFLYRRIKSQQK
jgi:LPXTG-motif cell wall-anchored protein